MALSRYIGRNWVRWVPRWGRLERCSRPGTVPDRSAEAHGWWLKVGSELTQETSAPQRFPGEAIGALGRIRTCAHGSGGRCSIP